MFTKNKKKNTFFVFQAICRTQSKNIIPGAYINDPHHGMTVVVKSVIPHATKDNYYSITVGPIEGAETTPYVSSTFGAEGEQMWTIYK